MLGWGLVLCDACPCSYCDSDGGGGDGGGLSCSPSFLVVGHLSHVHHL